MASTVIAIALLVGTAGCTFATRQATLIQYDPSSGVGANVGDVQVRNAIGIINEDGTAVSLLVTLINSGQKDVSISVQYQSGGQKRTDIKDVTAGAAASFGNAVGEEQIIIVDPRVKAGALLPVYVQYGDFMGKELLVPVLEAAGPYQDLMPVEAVR